jgi:hypothetical protein
MPLKFFKTKFAVVGPYIKDENRNVCFTITCDDELAQNIVNKLNGDSKTKFNVRKKMDYILIDNVIVLKTRGWGYLIGTLKLTPQQAKQEQENLMDYVVQMLRE